MTEWTARRFWTEAAVVREAGGHAVRLDGQPLRSPLKTPILMPTAALATAVAAEWQAQADRINPASMPLTRAVNATLDKVMPQRAEVNANLSDYGGTDLLCYRAAGPGGLVARQAAGWDPVLDWLMQAHQAKLVVTTGVAPVPQPAPALAALRTRVDGFAHWEVAALSEFVTLSGSLALALAVTDGHLAPDRAFDLSRIDEDFQAEQWGMDAEEAARVAARRADFVQAYRYLGLLRIP